MKFLRALGPNEAANVLEGVGSTSTAPIRLQLVQAPTRLSAHVLGLLRHVHRLRGMVKIAMVDQVRTNCIVVPIASAGAGNRGSNMFLKPSRCTRHQHGRRQGNVHQTAFAAFVGQTTKQEHEVLIGRLGGVRPATSRYPIIARP